MKHSKLFITVALFFIGLSAYSQQTMFERVLAKSLGYEAPLFEQTGEHKIRVPGEMCLRTFHTIGDVKKITFQVLESKNLKDGNVECFGRLLYGNVTSNKVNMAFITTEDIKNSIKLIHIAQSTLLTKKPDKMEELEYTNDSGYFLAVSKNSDKWVIRISSCHWIQDSFIILPATSADDLKSIFEKMEEKVEELSTI